MRAGLIQIGKERLKRYRWSGKMLGKNRTLPGAAMDHWIKLLPLFCLLLCGCATQPTQHGIPNFGKVDGVEALYRGGQPTLEGWRYLKSVGVTNIIKLNSGGNDYSMRQETLPDNWSINQFFINTRQQIFGGK